jgi:AcrR family transcriptional regulator
MAKPQQRGVLKRAKILAAAGELFALHGYESTTLARIGRASGAAIGSIEHLIGHKPEVATAVHEGVVADLTAVIEQALDGHRHDLPGAVHALLTAYFEWARAHPHHQRILGVLTDYAAVHGSSQTKGLQARVEPLLLAWATPLMKAAKVRSLTATQLFALIMAPAMASVTAKTDLEAGETEISRDWLSVLASIVIEAVSHPVPAARGKADRKAPPRTNDLFE